MKNKIFDKSLYVEAIRQTKLLGILSSSVLLLGFIFPFLTIIIGDFTRNQSIQPFELTEFISNPAAIVCALVFAPIITSYIFGFLNKRNSSDFYHSIPHTRQTISLTFILAVLTWTLVPLITISALSVAVYSAFPQCTVMYEDCIVFLINMCAASIATIGAAFLAKSLTGRGISNFLIYVIILIFPRLIISNIVQMTSQTITVLPDKFNFFDYNIPAGIFLFSSKMYTDGLTDFKSGLYTLILGIIYILFGVAVFKSRKSETAGSASLSPVIQNVFRICFAQLFCFIPTLMLWSIIMGKDSGYDSGIFAVIICLYIESFIAYVGYEIVTTKTLKNFRKLLPGLAIIFGINVIMLLTSGIITHSVNSFKPEPEDIESVSIVSLDYDEDLGFFGYYYISENERLNYYSNQIEKESFTDPEIIEIVSNSLKSTADRDSSYENAKILVKIKANGMSKERCILISPQNYSKLIERMLQTSGKAKSTFVLYPEVSIDDISSYSYEMNQLSDVQMLELYNSFRKEILNIRDYSDWAKLVLNNSGLNFPDVEAEIYAQMDIAVTLNGQDYDVEIPITKFTPETLLLWQSMKNYQNGYSDDQYYYDYDYGNTW